MNRRCLSIVFCQLVAVAVGSQTACNEVLGIPEPSLTENPGPIDPGELPEPEGSLVVTADQIPQIYDTDLPGFVSSSGLEEPPFATVTQSDGVELLVLSVETLIVEELAVLRLKGTRPVVFMATGDIEVLGTITAASNRIDGPGAGFDPQVCPAAVRGANDSGGGGGGGGGGFRGGGGGGGNGDSNGGQSAGGGGGGFVSVPTTIRGGCPGADGGDGNNNGTGGRGGVGGGAVGLVSATRIAVDGVINCGGHGGNGGAPGDGGGGGGSGGFMILDAPMITLASDAVLAANGGGGGEGGGRDDAGMPGVDGLPAATAASGGSGGSSEGADGGVGSDGSRVDGQSPLEVVELGGGGGGGGAGFILVRTSQLGDLGATFSPTHTTVNAL